MTFLLKKKASTSIKVEKTLSTPTHVAADKNNVKALKLLKKYKANMNESDCEGDTPLHRSIHWFKDDSIKCLMKDCKVDILQKNKCGSEAYR